MTVTLNFDPTGWDYQQFKENLQVLCYDDNGDPWKTIASGSDDTAILDWDSGTITFETDHFSLFAASSKQDSPPSPSGDQTSSSEGSTQAMGDDDDDGGGGCSVGLQNMSAESALINIFILILPIFIIGFRRLSSL